MISNDCQSSNAFWRRKSKSKGKKQQRNNSTMSETRTMSSKTFRQSIVERWKRNKKKSLTTINARSVLLRKRTNTNTIEQKQRSIHPLTTIEIPIDQSLSTQNDIQHSSSDFNRFPLQDNSNFDDDINPILESTIASCLSEQQNINATNNTNRSHHGMSQSTMENIKSITSQTNHSTNVRKRSKIKSSSKRKKSTQIRKFKKKNHISTFKRNNSRRFLSNNKRKIFPYTPFPNPNLFHSIPSMEDSEEITKENIRTNHLCCKPITSVKVLSSNDQKKLIEHDYLTLISLLPIYLASQDHFQQKIQEKTQISSDGAFELDRLMNEWKSARLFISANNPYKTLIQKI